MTFVRWTDIEGFHNVRKAVTNYDLHDGTIAYRGKIKLHGTNAGITVKNNGDVVAQSRSNILGTGSDNAGFAAWVESTKDAWKQAHFLAQVTIFGEWCGPGIMKGVAVTQIDEKQFAIFSIQYGEYDEEGNADMIVDPDLIKKFFDDRNVVLPVNVHILPWYGEEILVDYADTAMLETVVETLNVAVNEVEACDPWVKAVFSVEGIGEGIVFYPISFQKDGTINRRYLSSFMFKAKGSKHKVQKDRAAVILDPEVVADVNEFADKFVTEARLEQGAAEINRGVLDFEAKLIGAFIGWMSKDVQKESIDELEAVELEWKMIAKEISTRSRVWYLAKIQEI
jgi:hypothetical protein